MRTILSFAAAGLALAAQPALAQDVTIGGSVRTANVFDNAIQTTRDGAVQAWASASVTDECSMNAWVNVGPFDSAGDELDFGPVCNFALNDDGSVSLRLAVQRYVINNFPDATEFSSTATLDNTTVTLAYYAWEGGIEDAQRIQIGQNFDLSKVSAPLSARAEVTYETGFGVRDTVVVGGDLNYQIDDTFSLFLTAYVPVKESGINGTAVLGGINFVL